MKLYSLRLPTYADNLVNMLSKNLKRMKIKRMFRKYTSMYNVGITLVNLYWSNIPNNCTYKRDNNALYNTILLYNWYFTVILKHSVSKCDYRALL